MTDEDIKETRFWLDFDHFVNKDKSLSIEDFKGKKTYSAKSIFIFGMLLTISTILLVVNPFTSDNYKVYLPIWVFIFVVIYSYYKGHMVSLLVFLIVGSLIYVISAGHRRIQAFIGFVALVAIVAEEHRGKARARAHIVSLLIFLLALFLIYGISKFSVGNRRIQSIVFLVAFVAIVVQEYRGEVAVEDLSLYIDQFFTREIEKKQLIKDEEEGVGFGSFWLAVLKKLETGLEIIAEPYIWIPILIIGIILFVVYKKFYSNSHAIGPIND
jgi:hypothetical protein